MTTPVTIAVRTTGTAAARRDLQSLNASVGKASSALKRVAAVGAAAGAAGLLKFGVASVKAGSEAQQSLGATRTVFGKFATDVIRDSNRAAKAVGLSANDYRELANVTGSMLANAGIPLRKTADLTERVNKRGADLAATFGGPTSDAVKAVGSLLRGESDPIEQYGVSILQSDVNARLAAKGLDDLTGKSLRQAQAQARLKLLFEQTSKSAGQFRRESGTLAGQQQRLSASWEDLQAKAGKALLPLLTQATEAAGDFLPKLERLAPTSQQVSDALSAVAREGRPAWELLKDLGAVAGDVAGFLDGLPGPVKSLGVQAGIAALALPRLNKGLSVVSTSALSLVGDLRSAETRTQRLGAAARGAAGVGGLLALSQGAQTSNDALSALSGVAGGALLGLSVGGPIGAAIGAGAGLLTTLATNTDDAASSLRQAREPAVTFADSLNKITGAATRSTRALVLQRLEQLNALVPARELGIEQRDLVGHMLGSAAATKRVMSAMRGTGQEVQWTADQYGNLTAIVPKADANISALSAILGITKKELREQGRATREAALATGQLSRVFKGLPKKAVTRIRAEGIPRTKSEIGDLAKRYKLTPKEIRTVIRATNANVSLREILKYVRGVKDGANRAARDARRGGEEVGRGLRDGTAKARANLDPFQRDMRGKLTQLRREGGTGGAQIGNSLRDGTGKARANLGGFQSSLQGGINSARGTASSGGSSIGSALGAGVQSGLSGFVAPIANAAASLVRGAIAAARAAARAKSPSRETMRLGEDLGDGLVLGMRRREPAAKKGGDRLIRAIVGKRKGADAWKALNKALDQHNAKLKTARGRVKDLQRARDEYAKSIRDQVVASGNVTGLTGAEGEALTPAAMIDQLKAKVRDAKRFADLVRTLTESGLNKTTIRQLLEAGVEGGGLAAAETLTAGGKAALREVNQLTAELTKVGTSLGNSTAKTFHAAGIRAAQGLARGLLQDTRAIDRAADRIAKRLSRAVRKKLGIRSPSRVFEDIGRQTAAGLRIGIEAGNARRVGEILASDLVTGFERRRTPLTATAVWDQTGGASGGTVNLNVKVDAGVGSNPVEVGRQVVKAVDTYFQNGGRAHSRVWKS